MSATQTDRLAGDPGFIETDVILVCQHVLKRLQWSELSAIKLDPPEEFEREGGTTGRVNWLLACIPCINTAAGKETDPIHYVECFYRDQQLHVADFHPNRGPHTR